MLPDWAYYCLAFLAEMLWLPVMLNFARAWRSRKNPVSLSIVMLISFMMLLHLSPVWILGYHADIKPIILMNQGLGLAVCLNFYLGFYLSKERFKSSRKDG